MCFDDGKGSPLERHLALLALVAGFLIRFHRTEINTCIHFGHFDAAALGRDPGWPGHSEGYRHASLVDHATGSVHTGLSIDELATGGTLAPHVHSYEEGFYLLSGEAIVSINDQAYRLRPAISA